ncbi:arabinose efflux permease family protein [Frankia sp. QA3]|nr:arabinose efflux permease family protein [Frankia sp. QA3]
MSTPESTLSSGTDRMSGRARGVLLVLCGAIFLEGIDVAMLNVALPSIRSDLGMSTGELQWVMSAYVLGYGGFMLLGGRAADLFGRRQMFLFWLGAFILFSGLGGLANEGWVLILARFVTGVAAAFMAPAGLSIITTTFEEGAVRNRALLIYAGVAAAGFSIGLVVGGLLTTVSWRWVFFTPVILSIIIMIASVSLIEKFPRPDRTGQRVDLFGAVTVTGAILLLVLTVERATHVDVGWTIGTAAASFLLFVAFVVAERVAPMPLVRLGILRNGSLVRFNIGALVFSGGFFAFQFIAVLYLQELRRWSTVETSLALLAIGVDSVLSPTLTPRLVNRFGNHRVIFGGMLLAVLSYALFLRVGADWTYAAMFPTMLLLGIAFSLTYGPLTIAATDGVDEEEQGLAGGLLYTSFQFGAALGLCAATAVNIAATGEDGSTQTLLDGYHAALLVPLSAAILGAVVSAFGLGRAPTRDEPPGGTQAEVPVPVQVG